MCKAMSILVTKHDKAYWKMVIDSHEDLREEFKKDKDLEDHKEPPNNTFARIEINPKNGDYVNPDKWVYVIDERFKPDWLTDKHEKLSWKCHKAWLKQLNEIVDFKGIRKIKNPFTVKAPKKIDGNHLKLLRKLVSVRASVGASVRASVRASVWDSVWDTVQASVGASVWANIGINFKGIKKWKYTDKIKYTGYPFKEEVKMWKLGLVPAYDGKLWYLMGSPKANGKCEILWKGEIK